MMIALVGDTHFRGRDLENRIKVFKKMIRICEQNECSYIIHGGDLFDKGYVGDKKAPAEKIVKAVMGACSDYIPMILLSGNHDQYGEFGHGLDYIHHPLITKVDTVGRLHLEDDLDLFCIPWVRNDKDYSQNVYQKMQFTSHAKTRLVIGHLNVIGCSIGEHGYVNAESYFSFGLPDLQNTKFNPTNLFFSHIHTRMQLDEKSHYLGALTQLRFHEDEGKKAGFHLFDTDTGKLEFIDLSDIASEYFSIYEEDLDKYNLEKDYVRFYTDLPSNYENVSHVVALQRPLEEDQNSKVLEQIKTEDIDISHLIHKFCKVKNLQEPTSEYYKREKENLSLNMSAKKTGLDFIHDVRVKGVSIHEKERRLEFKEGFTVVTGPNGAGKTTLLESIYASLYDKFVKRGNVKNYMSKESFIETNLSSQGVKYNIRKNLTNKRFISFINGKAFELATQFKSAVEPIFGDAELFGKLVFLDSSQRFDLVAPASGTRLQVLRDLFDLSYFDEKQSEYKASLKDKLIEIKSYKDKLTEKESILAELEAIKLPDVEDGILEKLEEYRKTLAQLKANKIDYEKWLESNSQLSAILRFQKVHDPKKFAEAYAKMKELKQRLYIANNFKGVGCRENPLPCIFLKGKIEKTEVLEKELNDLLSEFDFKNYEYYLAMSSKYSPKMREASPKPVSEEDMENLREEITKLEVQKSSLDMKRRLESLLLVKERKLQSIQEELDRTCVDDLEDEAYALRFLVELSSKSGLSLYIIDIIKNEIQQILNELIGYADLNFSLQLSTSKKDDLDSFEILFKKDKKIYEVKSASDGEMALVRFLFKFALMIYLNRYYGNYKVLIADEPTAHVDGSNTEAILNMVRRLKKEFAQIIFITHDDQIANAADNRIYI